MSELIISPQAGFGNRMRSLVSAKILGDYLNRKVYHYWVLDDRIGNTSHVNEMKAITPEYFFNLNIPVYNKSKIDICYSEWVEGDYWWYTQSTAQSKLKCNNIQKINCIKDIESCLDESILIETSHCLIPNKLSAYSNELISAAYKKNFILNSRWQKIYESLPTYDWGISIRRGEFLYYFPDEAVSLDTAVDKINNLRGSKIIFSDDFEFRNNIRNMTKSYSGIDDSIKGVDSYFIQFLTLSKCKNILNTNKSSFGEQAALFGNSNYFTFNDL